MKHKYMYGLSSRCIMLLSMLISSFPGQKSRDVSRSYHNLRRDIVHRRACSQTELFLHNFIFGKKPRMVYISDIPCL